MNEFFTVVENNFNAIEQSEVCTPWHLVFSNQQEAWEAIINYLIEEKNYDPTAELILWDDFPARFNNWPEHIFNNGLGFNVVHFVRNIEP